MTMCYPIPARPERLEQHEECEEGDLILQSRAQGGIADGHGAHEDALRQEQLPLPQGPHAEGRDHQAHLQRGGTLWADFRIWIVGLVDYVIGNVLTCQSTGIGN